MSDIPEAHPLSQLIYEGVLERPPWKRLLKHLEAYLQVHSATLVMRRPQLSDPGLTVYLYSDLDKGALEDFRTKAHRDSPFAELPEKKVFTLYDRVTRSELEALDFYQYLKAYDVSDIIGFDVYDKQSHIRIRLRLARIDGAPAFSQEDRARLESIVPLMDNALKLYSAYTHNSFMEEFYEKLLGSMDIASVILNAKLEVLSANIQAKQILTSNDGVFLRRNSLRCSNSPDQEKLEKVCHELMAKARDEGLIQHTRSISINRTSIDTKWDVHIRSVEKKNVVFGEGGPELVLLLRGPIRDCVPSQSRLIETFGVTPAEAKLITHLVDGLTLTAAAEALGVSRNTARTQLSSIFTKTGVNRQSQLVKLVSDTFATHWQ
ncbi:MAG: DNA-binding CsgD family transcriptional regulator [Halioglobus sp.]